MKVNGEQLWNMVSHVTGKFTRKVTDNEGTEGWGAEKWDHDLNENTLSLDWYRTGQILWSHRGVTVVLGL